MQTELQKQGISGMTMPRLPHTDNTRPSRELETLGGKENWKTVLVSYWKMPTTAVVNTRSN